MLCWLVWLKLPVHSYLGTKNLNMLTDIHTNKQTIKLTNRQLTNGTIKTNSQTSKQTKQEGQNKQTDV